MSQARHLLKKVAVAALSLPLRVPNVALYGVLASLGFGVPNLLSHFRLCQVRGLLLALNSRNALAKETTRSLWSVPTLRAMRLFDYSCLDATLAEYSLSVVYAATLSDAPVWCERHPAELDGPVDIVTDGSPDGDKVGWSVVVVSPMVGVAEGWSGCTMVGVSSWVAEWCGKALALWLVGELGVPLRSVRSFVADNTGATYDEDSGCAFRYPWVDILHLRYAAALLQSGAVEIYVPAQHNSGSQSPVAMVQARAKQGMLAAEKGSVPFREWPGGHFCFVWRDVLAADPSAVLEACYSGAHVFVFDVPAGLSAARVRCVESGRVSLWSLSAAFWLCTTLHCHVEPEPVPCDIPPVPTCM